MEPNTQILVVDDEAHLRSFVRTLLNPTFENVTVLEAADETTALALYAEKKPDLVLLDINLVGCSGIRVLEQIRSLDPDAAIVMLSAVNARSIVEEAKAKGAIGYILKDTDPDELTTALIEVIQTRFG